MNAVVLGHDADHAQRLPNLLLPRPASAPLMRCQKVLGASALATSFSGEPYNRWHPVPQAPVKQAQNTQSGMECHTGKLPLWPASEGLREFYDLVEELAALWEDAGATDEQRSADTEEFAAVAAKNLQMHIDAWKRMLVDLSSRCEVVREKASGELDALTGLIDQALFEILTRELEEAARMPVRYRLAALQKAAHKISKQLADLRDMQNAVAEALRVLGFSRLDGHCGIAVLRAEMSRLKAALLERRCRALLTLGEEEEPIVAETESEYLQVLAAAVEKLEFRVEELRNAALRDAFRARSLWEELGEAPEVPRDNHVVQVLQGEQTEISITHQAAAAIKSSASAWESCRADAQAELEYLHKALRAFGVAEVVEPFLQQHNTVHRADRQACRYKLSEVLVALRAEEQVACNLLQQLYEETGLGSAAFQAFINTLDGADSRDARRRMLAKETKRLQRYLESIAQILGPLKELKALVSAAVAFEAEVQAGKNRFSGNSKHFLEEEKFRRRFQQRFPELRDSLIESIAIWESREQQKFLYHGLELHNGLLSIQGQDVSLIRSPGDLSCMDQMARLLSIANAGPASPALAKRHRRTDQTSPASNKACSRSSSRSSSASPQRGRKTRRARMVEEPPVALPPPPRRVNSMPQFPRPEGAPGAAVAAVRIASGLRQQASWTDRRHFPLMPAL